MPRPQMLQNTNDRSGWVRRVFGCAALGLLPLRAGQPLGIRATATRLSRDMSVKSILRAIALGSCLLVLTPQVVTAASANSWSVGPSMNAARYGHTATVLLDGRVLVTGGGSNPDAEIYNP